MDEVKETLPRRNGPRFLSQNVCTKASLKRNSATELLAPDQVFNIDVACMILGNNVERL